MDERMATTLMMTKTKKKKKKRNCCDKGALARPHFRIDWRQLTYYGKEARFSLSELFAWRRRKFAQMGEEPLAGRKRILNSLDGCFKSGELNAILGPSGAGKSTFLSALFGNKQEAAFGQTRVTWFQPEAPNLPAPMDKQQRTIRIAFLPQHDHLLNHLTVYETLLFASKIKNPQQAKDKQFHRANVKRVAKMLKLSECFNTRCGRLSGGQHKRVSIGQELLSEPDVIILDEPTSGLDAMTCLATIRTLKSIVTKHPISIVLTIHQPDVDVFNLFDRIYVIAQGGQAIYEGPPCELAPTLAQVNLFMPSESYNPARFIVENAFVGADFDGTADLNQPAPPAAAAAAANHQNPSEGFSSTDSSSCSDSESDSELDHDQEERPNLISRSISSLNEALGAKQFERTPDGGELKRALKIRDSGKRPLLNLGVQTADGRLVTADALQLERQQQQQLELRAKELASRMNLLRRLNQLQKASYYGERRQTTSVRPSTAASDVQSNLSSSTSTIASSYWEARESLQSTTTTTTERTKNATDVHIDFDEPGDSLGGCDTADERRGLAANLGHKFDKRLSAKHNQSRNNYPICYHSLLLAHRTWLSIVRDPVFFGIQFTMHTTIPILLALIFGSQQEEGCPQTGNFDLVTFAYQPQQEDFIQTTMRSIRQSIGNIGIIFFEMFVLSFAINCITALVFPLDMYVLLKEYRNGWYSLRSYFFGRTMADLPVPIVLHSMAMAILYYLTGQPFTWWRFGGVIGIVILASLVAQSVGLTIGALLMRSSQSAVLAAAGIVAPFFALSGFIVRIQTLPWAAQLAARVSYLYHLLNGFIILRYGFGRCPCKEEDFDSEPAHQIPSNLRTMASMWIGTYSNEFDHSLVTDLAATNNNNNLPNRTNNNVDPNIDIIDKLLGAFKMANSFGHRVESCADVRPYAMLDFNLKDDDFLGCCISLLLMLLVSRLITFAAIYYKIRSFS